MRYWDLLMISKMRRDKRDFVKIVVKLGVNIMLSLCTLI